MQLIDLISVIDENTTVHVKDTDNNILSYYDGKNSIDECYNKANVLLVTTASDYKRIEVIVNED